MDPRFRTLVAKRSSRVSEAQTQAGLWPADQMRTLSGARKLELARASKVDFLLMCRNGIITDAATVLGVERTQASAWRPRLNRLAVAQSIWTRQREGQDLTGLVAHHGHGSLATDGPCQHTPGRFTRPHTGCLT